MGTRPGRTMRTPSRPWTRTSKRVAKQAYVTGVPDAKIRIFEMGSPAKAKEFDTIAELVCSEKVQMRDSALESGRIAANKLFEKKILKENYFFKINVYPHQCIREHSMLTGAGADRLSDGMRLSFGRPTGRAAVAHKGQTIMRVMTYKKYTDLAQDGLYRASSKVPGKCIISVKKA